MPARLDGDEVSLSQGRQQNGHKTHRRQSSVPLWPLAAWTETPRAARTTITRTPIRSFMSVVSIGVYHSRSGDDPGDHLLCTSDYLQNGQQPFDAARVAAGAAVTNSPTNAATKARIFAFMIGPPDDGSCHLCNQYRLCTRLEGQPRIEVDLRVGLKVLY